MTQKNDSFTLMNALRRASSDIKIFEDDDLNLSLLLTQRYSVTSGGSYGHLLLYLYGAFASFLKLPNSL